MGSKAGRVWISKTLLNQNIPSKYQKCNEPIYRGFKTDKEKIDKLKAGKSMGIKKRLASSWSIDYDTAENFASSPGIILKINKPKDVLVNLNHPDIKSWFKPICTSEGLNWESEVIMRGAAGDINKITEDDIIAYI